MKKTIKSLLVICCVLLFIIGTGSLVAYLADKEEKNNSLSIGSNTISILQTYNPPETITPGISYKKDVQVRNDGLSDCYVRLKILFTDSDMEKFCTLENLNTIDWLYNEADNWYYYTTKLSKDELTASIFTDVSISNDIETYQIKDFEIITYAESIQANTFNDYEDAWMEYAKNKPTN